MGFRFWRRVTIAPGVTMNLSKSGASLSMGPRGGKITVGSRGVRATAGLTGTGLFYTTTLPGGGRADAALTPAIPAVRSQGSLDMGFFRRLVTPPDEQALVNACRELVLGNEDKALEHIQGAVHLADGAYLAGFLALRNQDLDLAARLLGQAAEKRDQLGDHFSRYGIHAHMGLPVTEEVTAHVGPDIRGVLLALAEVYQLLGRPQYALECLEQLRTLAPEDMIVKLSLAELLLESGPEEPEACKKVVALTDGVENLCEVHAAALLYRARALLGLGLPDAARKTLTVALRRRKDRSAELLKTLRYERALVYETLGRKRQARTEFEKIYAEDPGFEDVAARLGL